MKKFAQAIEYAERCLILTNGIVVSAGATMAQSEPGQDAI